MTVFLDSEGPNPDAQSDLGYRCWHMPEDTFSHGAVQVFLEVIISACLTSSYSEPSLQRQHLFAKILPLQ